MRFFGPAAGSIRGHLNKAELFRVVILAIVAGVVVSLVTGSDLAAGVAAGVVCYEETYRRFQHGIQVLPPV